MLQELLSQGRSIQDFKNKEPIRIFEEASIYPSFFDKHLVHPLRRIKVFHNDPNANIRAFYFQYLILCYEIENSNSQLYIKKIQQFLTDPNFTFLFLEDDDQLLFNDKQFKRFLCEFMKILDSGEYESTEAALNVYNIADIVFVYFFRSIIIFAGLTADFDSYVEKTVLFGLLLEYFNIDAQIFQDKCIKFIETEVFVYEESPTQVYLVYKDIQSMSESNHSRFSNSVDQPNKITDAVLKQNEHGHGETQGQVLQNISMLEEDLINSHTSSYPEDKAQPRQIGTAGPASLVDDADFKKNKILESQPQFHNFTELDEKRIVQSVQSQNQSEVQSQIQYSYKNSQIEMGSQRAGGSEAGSQIYQQDIQYLGNKYQMDEVQSHKGSATTALDRKVDIDDIASSISSPKQPYSGINVNMNTKEDAKLDLKHENSYKQLSSRQKASHSYFNQGYVNNIAASLSTRQHSITTLEPTYHQKPRGSQQNKYQNSAAYGDDQTQAYEIKKPHNKLPIQPDYLENSNSHFPINSDYYDTDFPKKNHIVGRLVENYGVRDPPTRDTYSTSITPQGKETYSAASYLPQTSTNYQKPTSSEKPSSPVPSSLPPKQKQPEQSPFYYSDKPRTTNASKYTHTHTDQESLIGVQKDQIRNMITQKMSVSKEFTDSLTLMKMGEPYSRNIKNMKARSREFRQSILNSFK